MAPALLFDISNIDLNAILRTTAEIEAVNPHRGAMRMLDGVIWADFDAGNSLAYKDVRHDEFWVEGHIPGRPIFPGVLMIEAAAQFASYFYLRDEPDLAFMGFAGVENVKFRGMVTPGDRLILLLHEVERRRRRCKCQVQGLVDGNLVFEAMVIGMPM